MIMLTAYLSKPGRPDFSPFKVQVSIACCVNTMSIRDRAYLQAVFEMSFFFVKLSSLTYTPVLGKSSASCKNNMHASNASINLNQGCYANLNKNFPDFSRVFEDKSSTFYFHFTKKTFEINKVQTRLSLPSVQKALPK